MTRRQLGRLAGTALVPAAQVRSQPAAKYTGALDGFESKVDAKGFDPVAWTRTLYEQAPMKLTFRSQTAKQTEAWQKKLRPKLAGLLGVPFAQRGAMKPETLEVREFPAYRREKFIFEASPGSWALAYLLTPKQGKGPFATMVCVPGHGRGVDDIVAIDDKGQDRADKAGYQHDFAIQAVEHGLAAVAIEPMSFGCRRDATAKKKGLGTSACQPTAGAALLLGQTMIGWRVRDVMRTIDWIETRSELDARRVGCMGISGGGTCTLFASALEPRIRVALVSGYLCTFKESIFSLSHCIDNYVPGILEWAEMYDIGGLIAPRPLFVESGDKDSIFPVAACKESVARVRKVYEALGAGDRVGHEVFAGEHSFSGREGFPFLKRYLTTI
ncbi:MAG: alpha/beta hydrolase family protein [Bryobacteraceae bacterium]